MGILQNLRVLTKLLLLTMISIMGLGTVVLISIDGIGTVFKLNGKLYGQRVVPLTLLKQVSDLYAVNIVDAAHKVRNGNFTPEEGLSAMNSAQGDIHKLWDEYRGMVKESKEQEAARQVEGQFAAADETVKHLILSLKERDTTRLAAIIRNELYQSIDPVSGSIGELINYELSASKTDFSEAEAIFSEWPRLLKRCIAFPT